MFRLMHALVVVALSAFPCLSSLHAIADEFPQALQEHLRFNEFGPAIDLAQQLPEVDARDRALLEVARAQRRAGAGTAALSTARSISDGTMRSSVFDEAPMGAPGGESLADFDSLIELITTTIAPSSWDVVGGNGSIMPFAGGVYVDALGVMRPTAAERESLASLRRSASVQSGNNDVARTSPLRKVSLPRLEREAQLRLASGKALDDEMMALAGIERVQYVIIYPNSGDVVIAGPASPWQTDAQGRIVTASTGRPLPRLDDLVVLLRHVMFSDDGRFGCSITPTQEGLAKTHEYLDARAGKGIKAGERRVWMDQLKSRLGAQEVSVRGIDPRSRAARVLVEADRHMKLVGLGLAESVAGAPSYLDLLASNTTGAPPDLNVLRWWFTLEYDEVRTTPENDIFEFSSQGVRVLSENELLTKTGERVHTGGSDEWTAEFAHQFTAHFDELSAKYPQYAELQNIFDLAMVAALIRSYSLADRVGWRIGAFGDSTLFSVQYGQAPETVESVMNHRTINRRHIVAAISGGVDADPLKWVTTPNGSADASSLESARGRAMPTELAPERWWWD